jgi:hypothetical protein
MTAIAGEWGTPPVVNSVPTETIRYDYPLTTPPAPPPPPSVTALDDRDLFVIHAALLYTGKVLWFCGHAERMHYATVSYVFDPGPGTLTKVPFPGDLFCCHFVQIEDGRLLTVGGSDFDFASHGSAGARNVYFFDPAPSAGFPMGKWIDTGKKLLRGRWYPTAVILGDGRVLVFSGRREYRPPPANPVEIADIVEVLSPPDYTPREVTGGATLQLPLYPGLHLAPDGRIYYSHTNWGHEISQPTMRALRVTGPTSARWDDFVVLPVEFQRREEGMSVLLPPAQDGKILVVGGSEALDTAGNPIIGPLGLGTANFGSIADPADPTRATIINTVAGGPPTLSPAAGGGTTARGRINGHLVLLPDETVLVCGGHNNYKWLPSPATRPSRETEIYTPSGPEAGFRTVASMTHPRMYHSAALLLPDGRVVVAGGADANAIEPRPAGWPSDPASGWPALLRWPSGAFPLNRKEREVYRPPYLFYPGAQPVITSVSPTQIPYGSTFTVTTPQAANIRRVALMRPGAVTHHTDSEQRYVPLTTFTVSGNNLTVTMLPDTDTGRATAPPGYYMLWIADEVSVDVGGGVSHTRLRPCQRARFVQIPAAARSAPTSSWPCIVATVALGSADAPAVSTLRGLRAELETATTAGRHFVRIVNCVYYAFSPGVAAWLSSHERARLATRDVLVLPAAAVIRAIERAVAPVPVLSVRHGMLMLLLLLLMIVAAVGSPALALLLAVHAAVCAPLDRRWRTQRRASGNPDAARMRSGHEGGSHVR